MVNFNKTETVIKIKISIFTDVTDFDKEQTYICILTQTTTVNSMSNVLF